MKLSLTLLMLVGSVFVQASEAWLNHGESLNIEISGCESYEQGVVIVNKNTITGKCMPATCRSIYDRDNKVYKVYRYEHGECSYTECNEAELVGEYISSVTPGSWERVKNFFRLKALTRSDLEGFINLNNRCGLVQLFRDGYTRDLVVKRLD